MSSSLPSAAAAAAATTKLSSVGAVAKHAPSVDLWSDLLVACFVIFIVLAPSYFFRVEQPTGRTSDRKTKSRKTITLHAKSYGPTGRHKKRQQWRMGMEVESVARKRPQREKASATQAAVAGAFSGAFTRLIAAPFDLVKIRFQVQQAPISATHSNAKYVGFIQSLRSIHAEEGLKSFWRGNLPATGLWVSYSAIQFGTYKRLQSLWPQDIAQQHSSLVSSANGATAGVFATIITYPLDLFRTVFASQGVPKPYPTMHSLVVHTFETRGVRGFYSGIGPTLFQIAPYMGLSFGIYSSLNEMVAKSHADVPLVGAQWALSFVGSGAVAGLLSKLAVYPLDTVKKRMQVRHMKRNASYGAVPSYTTSWQCFLDILRHEGVIGLYKGTYPSLLKSMVTHSSTFAAYEVALVALQNLEVVDARVN